MAGLVSRPPPRSGGGGADALVGVGGGTTREGPAPTPAGTQQAPHLALRYAAASPTAPSVWRAAVGRQPASHLPHLWRGMAWGRAVPVWGGHPFRERPYPWFPPPPQPSRHINTPTTANRSCRAGPPAEPGDAPGFAEGGGGVQSTARPRRRPSTPPLRRPSPEGTGMSSRPTLGSPTPAVSSWSCRG